MSKQIEALKLALEALVKKMSCDDDCKCSGQQAITAIKEVLAQPEPVAWKYDVTYNQDGTVSVALPDGDELRIVLPNQQEPYCWTWDVWVSGGKWRAEYGWEKPTEKVVNLQPLYTAPPQRTWVGLTDEEIKRIGKLDLDSNYFGLWYDFARAIEAKLRSKNT
jgi:hypothetical protein